MTKHLMHSEKYLFLHIKIHYNMQIDREMQVFLMNWKVSRVRKPLILRGARQVGKTTVVRQLGKSYSNYLEFNLEKAEDKRLFEKIEDISNTISLLFIAKGMKYTKNKESLIFIDEVQELPDVIKSLRYFYEEFPDLHVIVSGSLLDFALENIEKTPVGRVLYAEMTPINFREYLKAIGKQNLVDLIENPPLNEAIVKLILPYFRTFTMLGGMPEIVKNHIAGVDLSALSMIFNGLVEAYKNDIEKYSESKYESQILNHIIESAPFTIDQRINFSKFGNSSYTTKEVGKAFSKLEKARLIHLNYPSTATNPPISLDFNKRPKLFFLDVGIINFQLGLLSELLLVDDLNDAYRGRVLPQIIMQEIVSSQIQHTKKISFWVREERGTSSEVDIVIQFKDKIIPIEVKSGASGSLKSLHEFMDRCEHTHAIRMYAGPMTIDTIKTTKGKSYTLLNLPYFLGRWIDTYIDWFIRNY